MNQTFSFIVLLFASNVAVCQPTVSDSVLINDVLNYSYQKVRDISKISPIILRDLKELTNYDDAEKFISNPNEEFQATDIVGEKKLPYRRLIFAGISEQYSFIFYEVGGVAYHLTLVFFKKTDDKFLPISVYVLHGNKSKYNSQKQLFDFLKSQFPIKSISEILTKDKRSSLKTEIRILKLRPSDYQMNL